MQYLISRTVQFGGVYGPLRIDVAPKQREVEIPGFNALQNAIEAARATEKILLMLLSHFVGTRTRAFQICLLYTSPSPRDKRQSRMPSSA